ncbi:MAG: trypsin-like peptidase domain-containing protein, partial [Acidimicrobiia bacterium]|nr:trypsin-like peptidase domain-containing protein [Acidimicrobiia bacterium]
DGAEWLKIRLSTGENFTATLVGTDESKDLAVLSVGEGRSLPVADLAVGEEIRVGQIAVAIGSPFQLQQTVTAGIVSAVDRPVPSRTPGVVVAMIQTDAPINPGNSGGALADRNGRVIGINTAIQTDGFSGTNAGVGFAIPIDDAVRIADLLVAGEPIEPGFLGVTGQPPDDGAAGVEIVEVTAGSAADAAGLRSGDRVLSLDGAPVTQIEELAGLVLARQAGDQVTLHVVRGDQELEIEAVLGVRE